MGSAFDEPDVMLNAKMTDGSSHPVYEEMVYCIADTTLNVYYT